MSQNTNNNSNLDGGGNQDDLNENPEQLMK